MAAFKIASSLVLIISVIFHPSCADDSSPTAASEPSVSFLIDKTTARAGELITFTNTSQNTTTFVWDFGDGDSSTANNPSHSYSDNGRYTITLTAEGPGGSGSKAHSVTIENPTLELTFHGDKCTFQGLTTFKAGRTKLIFNNQSSLLAASNLVKHADGYSHQDMRDLFVDGFSTAHHPSWTTEVAGVWFEVNADKSHTWTGNLGSGLYTLVGAKLNPIGVWYAAGLTVYD